MNKIKKYFQTIIYATKIIWTASPKYFTLKMIFSLISSLLPYVPLFLWRDLLNELTLYISGEHSELMQKIIIITALYCGVLLIEKLNETLSDYIMFKYNDEINYYLDNLMIDRASTVDLAFFDSSDLNDKLNNSLSLLYSIKNIANFVFNFLQRIIRLIISLALFITLGIWIVPVIIILCIPVVIGDQKINKEEYNFNVEHVKDQRRKEYYKDLFFEGAKQEVRLYNLHNYFMSLYKNIWAQLDADYRKKDYKKCFIRCISLVILTINEVIVYILAITKLIVGKIAVGDVAYYISLLTRFRGDFMSLCRLLNLFERNSKELEDIKYFVEMKPLLEKSGALVPGKNPRIEFKNVFFKYPNAENFVLKDCSFVIEPGETLGLVGLNGSGKSTIVKLLCRFYDPCEGNILIDGIDNKEYDIVKLRALFGVLFQDYVRYSFSLRKNIALSDLSRIDDDDAIEDACTQSNVSKFINEWENGIDENMTRRFDKKGKELSGGQWQRVSLARAFFRDAPIVLLDEPSAALDPVAEHDIFEKFSKLSHHKTAVLISHRLSSITLADKIIVLKDGRIIENGSHSELLELDGEYAHLFNLQASKYM